MVSVCDACGAGRPTQTHCGHTGGGTNVQQQQQQLVACWQVVHHGLGRRCVSECCLNFVHISMLGEGVSSVTPACTKALDPLQQMGGNFVAPRCLLDPLYLVASWQVSSGPVPAVIDRTFFVVEEAGRFVLDRAPHHFFPPFCCLACKQNPRAGPTRASFSHAAGTRTCARPVSIPS